MAGKGIGFGKTILFGEHFVVYGLAGIAGALGNRTIAEIEKSEKFEFIDNRPETPGYKEKKKDEIQRQLDSLLEQLGLEKEGNSVKITLAGTLVCSSGMGASAALAVSIARGLNELFEKGLDDKGINKIAHTAEEAGSGPASGIDDTCSTFGGFIKFEKNLEGGPNKIELISMEKPAKIVLVSTGITQETKKVVADVKAEKEKNPEKYKKIFAEYEKIFNNAIEAIETGDIKLLGKLMDKNMELLRKMTLSCDEIEKIIAVAKSNGALGAKLTGTGRGGLVICLCEDEKAQEKIAEAVEKEGFKAIKTEVGKE